MLSLFFKCPYHVWLRVCFILIRGVLLHTAIMAPTHQKVKAVACYCHGYGDNVCYTKRKELARLVQNGIAVVMIDYEGFGKSDGTLGLVKDWNIMVDDVCTYFEHVKRTQFPGQKLFLIGEVRIATDVCLVLSPVVVLGGGEQV
jgi:alpha-beta hydrolase superfamily lysophospholipase